MSYLHNIIVFCFDSIYFTLHIWYFALFSGTFLHSYLSWHICAADYAPLFLLHAYPEFQNHGSTLTFTTLNEKAIVFSITNL